jgi:hypothetical protein
MVACRPVFHGNGRLEANSGAFAPMGGSTMRFNGIASPEQLALLHQIFDDCCRAAGIKPGDPDREILALRIMSLFESGLQTSEELMAALEGH